MWVEENKIKILNGFIWQFQSTIRFQRRDEARGGVIMGVKEEWRAEKESVEREGLVRKRMKVKKET